MFEIQYRWIIACQRFRSQLNLITAKQFDELIKVSFWNFSKCLECVFERYIEAYIQVRYFSPTNTKIYFLPRLRVIYQSHRFWTRFLSLSRLSFLQKVCLHFIRLKSISVLLFHDYGWDISIPRYHRLCITIRQDILPSWFCSYDIIRKRNISYYNIDSYSFFKIKFFSYYNILLRISIISIILIDDEIFTGIMRINYIRLHHWLYQPMRKSII